MVPACGRWSPKPIPLYPGLLVARAAMCGAQGRAGRRAVPSPLKRIQGWDTVGPGTTGTVSGPELSVAERAPKSNSRLVAE